MVITFSSHMSRHLHMNNLEFGHLSRLDHLYFTSPQDLPLTSIVAS